MSAKAKVEHFLSLNMPGQAEALLQTSSDSFKLSDLYTLLARAQFMRGNSTSARLSARKSTRHLPTSAEAWRVRALPEIAARRSVPAKRYLRRAILLDPAYVSAYATATTHSRSANEPADATRFSHRAEIIGPHSDEVLRSKAALLFTTGRLDEANAANRRALLLAPSIGRPYFLAALMDKALGQPWTTGARRALAIQPADDGPRMLIVEKLSESRNQEAIAKEVRRVALSNPDMPVGYLYLAAGSDWVVRNTDSTKLVRWLQPLGLDAQLCGRQFAMRLAALGHDEQAISVLRTLVDLDPSSREARFVLGGCLRKFERYNEAEVIAKRLINSDKADRRGWLLYAELLQQQGFYEAAERVIKGGLRYTEKDYALWSMYGSLLFRQERYGRAIKIYQRALLAAPTLPQAYEQLAAAYDTLSKEAVATKLYARGMRFKGKSARGIAALSSMALQSGDEDLALKYAKEALELDPIDERAIGAYVAVLVAKEDFAAALDAARRQYLRLPEKASVVSIYATTLARSGRADEAVELLHEKMADAPRSIELIRAYMSVSTWLGQPAMALSFFHRMYRLHTSRKGSQTALAMQLLWLGHWAAGFDVYETGFDQVKRGRGLKRKFVQKRWEGEDLTGKSIVVHTEQGIGDEIMFATAVSDLSKWASKVQVEATKRVTRLFRRAFPDVEVISHKVGGAHETDEDVDYFVPIGSLPRVLRRKTSLFGRNRPYLQPDPELSQSLRQSYKAKHGDDLIVGIGWRGGSGAMRRKQRSFTEADLLPVLKIPGVTFVCIQYGDVEEEVAAVNRELDQDIIFDPTVDPLKDLVASASQIAACDMVISATNAGVHTAGGLGVPCWALVPFESDWRWTWGRHDVLWYPGMRLFRQERLDETWGEVIDRVTHDFQSLLAGDRSYLRSPPADDLEW